MGRSSGDHVISRMLKGAARAALGALLGAAVWTAGAAPTLAQPSETAPKRDWAKRCSDEGVCVIQTGLTDEEGRVVALLLLRRHPEQGLIGELRSPLGLHIPTGIRASVDDSFPFEPTLFTCDPRACLSIFRATDELVAAMKKGGKLNVSFVDIRRRGPVNLSFSLIGFTASLNEL